MVDPVLLVTLAGSVAGIVAIAKSLIPDMSSRQVIGVVLVATTVVFGAAVASDAITGDVLTLLTTWVQLAMSAIGFREGVTAIPGAGPRLSALPQVRKGTGP